MINVKHTYLKALIGDNADFVVYAGYNEGPHGKVFCSPCIWMVPGTYTDKWDDCDISRYSHNVVLMSRRSAA